MKSTNDGFRFDIMSLHTSLVEMSTKSTKMRDMFMSFVVLFSVCTLLSACSTRVEDCGYSFGDLGDAEKKIASIKVGRTGEIEVLQLLGSPSTISNFGQDKFFYIESKMAQEAFYRPRLLQQKVLEISFDNHVVTSIKRYDVRDAKFVVYDEQDIYIKANKLGVVEQLLKNFGRFNAKQGQSMFGAH